MKATLGAGIVVAAFFCILTAEAVQASSTIVSIPSNPWIAYYTQAIKRSTHNNASLTMRFPQVYLYDPQGNPMAFVQSPQKLKEVLEQIPIHTPGENVAKHPLSLAAQLRLLRRNGASGLAGPPKGKWTVVFYGLADSAAAKKLAQILKVAPPNIAKKLYIIRVNLRFKSIPVNNDNPKK